MTSVSAKPNVLPCIQLSNFSPCPTNVDNDLVAFPKLCDKQMPPDSMVVLLLSRFMNPEESKKSYGSSLTFVTFSLTFDMNLDPLDSDPK